MESTWPEQLDAWHDFYVIVGTAAAALTGLMFVVASLRTQAMAQRTQTGVRAYVTPTVFYLATPLIVAALMAIPTLSRLVLAGVLALGGLGALAYLAYARPHTHWRKSPFGADDWIFYVGLPHLGYFLVLAAALTLWFRPAPSLGLELLAGTVILLLVVGIRNAWDLVMWVTRLPR
jgi:hypothetical protein